MQDQQTIELVMPALIRKSGEPLGKHMLYTIRNGVAQALQAKERHRQRMTAPEFKWQKPVPHR